MYVALCGPAASWRTWSANGAPKDVPFVGAASGRCGGRRVSAKPLLDPGDAVAAAACGAPSSWLLIAATPSGGRRRAAAVSPPFPRRPAAGALVSHFFHSKDENSGYP